jgi:hypothetical protein
MHHLYFKHQKEENIPDISRCVADNLRMNCCIKIEQNMVRRMLKLSPIQQVRNYFFAAGIVTIK